MNYRCDHGCCHELLWNSRDGVTPFILNSKRGHPMTHVDWKRDIRDPGHKPCRGDRIFIDATSDIARPRAVEYVEKHWEQTLPGPATGNIPPIKTLFADKETAIKHFVNAWVYGHGEASPWVIEVEENWK